MCTWTSSLYKGGVVKNHFLLSPDICTRSQQDLLPMSELVKCMQ
jgi:hypothetical protein